MAVHIGKKSLHKSTANKAFQSIFLTGMAFLPMYG